MHSTAVDGRSCSSAEGRRLGFFSLSTRVGPDEIGFLLTGRTVEEDLIASKGSVAERDVSRKGTDPEAVRPTPRTHRGGRRVAIMELGPATVLSDPG